MRPNEVDLALHLLDDQLVDAEGRRCGRVDDVELEGGPGAATRVAAVLVGPAAWPARLPRPLAGVAARLVPGAMHRIDWDAVEAVTTSVKLARTARELGLGTKDGRSVRWVNALPAGAVRLSSLLGQPVVREDGTPLGRVHDLRAERLTTDPGGSAREPWLVTGLLVGRLALLERLGVTKEQRLDRSWDASPPSTFVGWGRVREIQPDRLMIV